MFDGKQLEMARHHLLDGGSDDLIRFMQHKSLSLDTGLFTKKSVQIARDLGWTAGPSGSLTRLGIHAADSCREYQFWLERGKALPFEGGAPHLSRRYFKDRSVLEIGSGMGANLMSLSGAGAQVCGVEPVAAYSQLGAILCEREGMPGPDVRQGSAEALPFADNEADLVLCVSAHQYFDIRPAMTEISRVLKPGGELIIIGGTLQSYVREGLKELLHRRGGMKAYAITIINTLSYMTLERRIIPGRGGFTTSRPVYPTRSAMKRWLSGAGLAEAGATVRVGPEACFFSRLKQPYPPERDLGL